MLPLRPDQDHHDLALATASNLATRPPLYSPSLLRSVAAHNTFESVLEPLDGLGPVDSV